MKHFHAQNRRCISRADRSMHVLVMRQRASHSNTEKVGHKLPPDCKQVGRRELKAKGRRYRLSRLAIFAVVADDELVVQVVTCAFFCPRDVHAIREFPFVLNTRFSRVARSIYNWRNI